MKKKFLFVFPLAENFTLHWIGRVRAIVATGAEVHVAVPDSKILDAVDVEGICLHRMSASRGSKGVQYDLSLLVEIARIVGRVRPDLLHAATTRPVIYAGVIARILHVPAVILSVTGLGHLFIDRSLRVMSMRRLASVFYRFALKNPHARSVFENENDRDEFVRLGLVAQENTEVLIGGGLDLEQYRPTAEPETDTPLVVLAGRLLKEKGVFEFAEAARILKSQNVKGRFALVGDVDNANPATVAPTQIKKWVSEGVLEWWGWVDEMTAVYQQANVFCLPSYREGAPRCIMEAAASSRPVVATDVPGCRSVVVDGVTGKLVPARDAAALAAALKCLLEDAAAREKMGAAARRFAEENFSQERRIADWRRVYEGVLLSARSQNLRSNSRG